MAEKMGVYRCQICGNVVEVFVAGKGELVCCGQPMKFLDERAKDGAGEKHVPVVEDAGGKVKVKVGEVEHPMVEDHYIQFIEVILKNGIVLRKDLNPGEKPEAVFDVKMDDIEKVREECNKHGLWSK